MTPENDKTLRGIFRPVQKGIDEWDDRRKYRTNRENTYNIGQNGIQRNDMILSIMSDMRLCSPIDDLSDDSDERYETLYKYLPESKTLESYVQMMTFGYGRTEDGKITNCDCCGAKLNVLNTNGYGLCDPCEKRVSSDDSSLIGESTYESLGF